MQLQSSSTYVPYVKTVVLPSLDAVLTTAELSAAMKLAGHFFSENTIVIYSRKGSRYPGPPFAKIGATKIYRFGDALQWAETRQRPTRGRPEKFSDAQRAAMRTELAAGASVAEVAKKYGASVPTVSSVKHAA